MINLCTPAIVYLIFSLTQILIDIYKGLYNTAFMKSIVMVMVTMLLNILCVDDDSGPTQEYSTIQAAVNDAQPGDTIFVREGTYDERIDLVRPGTSSAYITIQAYPGDNPIIQVPSGEPGFKLNAYDYIKIHGFEIVGGQHGIYTVPNREDLPSRHIIITNNNIHDQANCGIWARVNDWTIINNTFWGTGYIELQIWPSINTEVYRNVSILVENNTFLGHVGEDHTRFSGDHIIIHNNYFEGKGGGTGHDDSIPLECTNDVLIERNVFINTLNWDMDAETCGVDRTLNDTRIIGNVIKGIGGHTVALKEGTYEITGNTFTDAKYAAIRITNKFDRNPPEGIVKNNIFFNNTDYNGFYDDGVSQDIDYNLYWQNGNPIDNEDNGVYSFSADPLFININDPLGPDGIMWTDDDGFRLQSDSTACGTGEGGIDIGAYECSVQTHHRSDISKDGCVDTDEMIAFMDRWKISSTDVPMPELMESIGLWKSGSGCS